MSCGCRGRCNAPGASLPEAPPDPPLYPAVANTLTLFSAAVSGAATGGGGIPCPEVDQEVGHPEPVVDVSVTPMVPKGGNRTKATTATCIWTDHRRGGWIQHGKADTVKKGGIVEMVDDVWS